jgi:hypothetical protein
LEEKKSVRQDARNAERLAMQSFQAKTDVLEVYTKVLFHKLLYCLQGLLSLVGLMEFAYAL